MIRFVYPVIGIVTLCLIWELAHQSGVFDSTLLPGIFTVIESLLDLVASAGILSDIGWTLLRAFGGFVLAVIVGVPLGISMGMFKPIYHSMLPLVDFFRSIPVTTLYPIFVLLLGVRDSSKIGMIFTACVFVITLNSAYGVTQAKPVRRQMASLYGCSKYKILRLITFKEALPQTFIGLRVALSLSLIVAVLGEMFMGCEFGLGQRLTDAYTTFAVDRMYALVFLTGLIGFILNRLFVRVEKRFVPWAGL
ncbi:MAG: ABC transporter permease [Nitrospirae bacterium]|nr:ABC transporter permease [Nitrospirota bacterium]